MRTTSANRRFRTSSWIRLSRSSASSLSSIWRSVFRVIRNVYQPRISTPGKSASRFAPITSSSGTNWLGARSGTQRGRILGTFTRAKRSSPSAPAQHDREREAQVRDVGERMPGIDRERREDREDVGVEVGVELLPVRPAVGRPELRMEHHPVIGQCRQHLVMQAARCCRDQLPDRRADGASCSSGVMPSAVRSTMPAATCCFSPATRTRKNSSRLLLKMPRNLSRSSSGVRGSSASCSTRRLNSSQESSRLM